MITIQCCAACKWCVRTADSAYHCMNEDSRFCTCQVEVYNYCEDYEDVQNEET